MTISSLNLAMIGFEFKHHVPAFIKAIHRLNEKQVDINPVIWSARDGVKKDVIKHFPDCEFLDAASGWFGEFKKKTRLLYKDKITLSDLEIKHFSYTYSRTRFLRDPRKITEKDILLYHSLVNFAMTLLTNNKVKIIFFSKLPHSMMDLSFLYAARRLNIGFVYTDGPFYGDDYVFPRGDEVSLNLVNLNINIYSAFKKVMEGRNLKKNLSLPHYQTADLSYMPSVPESSVAFFHRKEMQVIYRFVKSKKIAQLIGSFVSRLLIFISWGLRKVLLDRSMWQREKKYILVLLQYHPEQTTSPSAADTPFEEERVVAIAEQFPDYQIIMREHPSNLESDSYLVYRNPLLISKLIKKNENIYYLLPGDRQAYKKLIENAFFTVSTCGTVAIESIQLGVPSIHFYSSFASGFPGVHIVKNASMITKEMIDLSRDNLIKMGNSEIFDVCYKVVRSRKLVRGFICGYHENFYNKEEYISNASNVIYESLNGVIFPDMPN